MLCGGLAALSFCARKTPSEGGGEEKLVVKFKCYSITTYFEMSDVANEVKVIQLIDLLLAHKKEYVQEFLKENGFRFSGTKEDLRERLLTLYKNGEVTYEQIVQRLDQIEGYGNQHVYLFRIPEHHIEKLRDQENVRRIFEENNLGDVYNHYKPLDFPERPEVVSITHNDDWLKIRWVVKREKTQLLEEKREIDEQNREILTKKYVIRKYRGVTMFRVSLISGDAELLIHRLPHGSGYAQEYAQERDRYLGYLNEWFNWGLSSSINLHPVISRIENSGEVRTRNVGLRTARGSHIDISSPSRTTGIQEDPDAINARQSISKGVGSRGNFYWLPEKSNGALSREIHTIIYPDRISFLGECSEEEVNYVLGRIRHYLQ